MMSEVGQGNVSIPSIVAAVTAAAQGGATGAFKQALSALDGAALGLIEDEAQDFDTLVTNFVQELEAGKTAGQAWKDVWEPFKAAERSQLWKLATDALQGLATAFHFWMNAFEDGFKTIAGVL